jgi:hypothetical protein
LRLSMEEVEKLKAEIDNCPNRHRCFAFGTGEMQCGATRRCEDSIALIDTIEAQQQEIEGLQEFAKAKAEDRLIELPCKVGDKVWLNLETLNGKFEIVESVLTKVFHTIKDSYISCWIDCPGIGNSLEFQLSDFGKTVFLTREAAEKALGGDTP